MIVQSLVLFILAALFFCDVDSASPQYCMAHLNMSDCGGHKTQVYHYYKPGSICKLAVWKGCPTENMFTSVHECNKQCIRNKVEKVRVVESDYRCDIPLDTHVCALQSERVYTYCNEKQSCVEADWYGCPSLNKFNDKETCEETCYDTEIDWKNKLQSLDMRAIKGVQSVVDELLKTNDINNENDHDMNKDIYPLHEIPYSQNLSLAKVLRRGYQKVRKSYVPKNLKTNLPNYLKNQTIKRQIKQNASKQNKKEKHNVVSASKQNKTETQNAVNASKQNEAEKQNAVNASKQNETEKQNAVNASKQNETEKQNAVNASKQNETEKQNAVNASKQNETEKQNAVSASKQNETENYNDVNANKRIETEIYNAVNASKQNETEKQNAEKASKQNEAEKNDITKL